jgi:hypothetical protein
MSHWLDEEINRLKEKELNLDQEKIRTNYATYHQTIDNFFNALIKSSDDLHKVMGPDYKFSHRTHSVAGISGFELVEISAVNFSQKPAFLRRLRFILSDQSGKVHITLFRGKHNEPDEPWKFHDQQDFHFDIARLDDKIRYEMIDWFAWKTYSPRELISSS